MDRDAWNRGGYYGARGVGSAMIYEQPYSSLSTNTTDYSCNIIAGRYDGNGNWIPKHTVCAGD